jgi:hypothetical protein
VSGITSYLLFGIAIIAVLAGVLYFYSWRGERKIPERKNGRQILILGIIFLIPGLLELILNGETSAMLTLGIIFTLSGLVSVFLLKPSIFPGDSEQIVTGALIGFLLGGALGAAISMVFSYPSVLAILVSGSLGILGGVFLSIFYRRSSQF